jgi:c(7)-type cytochrome triheme protein
LPEARIFGVEKGRSVKLPKNENALTQERDSSKRRYEDERGTGVAYARSRGVYTMESRASLCRLLAAVVVAATAMAAPLAAEEGAPEVRLPADVTYRSAEGSPGPVVFSHTVHVPLADDRCIACHPALFPILRPTGKITHAEMSAGKECGACHDGVAASGIEDDCAHCHRSGEKP